jgi:hypothetical protein
VVPGLPRPPLSTQKGVCGVAMDGTQKPGSYPEHEHPGWYRSKRWSVRVKFAFRQYPFPVRHSFRISGRGSKPTAHRSLSQQRSENGGLSNDIKQNSTLYTYRTRHFSNNSYLFKGGCLYFIIFKY